jgi:hypothetical protein
MAELASMLTAMVESMGEEAVAEQLAVLPDDLIESLRELAKNDPLLVDVLLPLLPEEDRRPQYESWFVKQGPPKKPDKGLILDLAERDREWYEEVRGARERWLALYHQDQNKIATFKGFNADKDEKFSDSSISDQMNAMIARGGAIEPNYDVPILKVDLRDEGQKAEDFLMWCDRMEAFRHAEKSGASLRREEWMWLCISGMVCWGTMLDPEDTTYFFQDRLYDPNTVYPFWDDHGLYRVTRIYQEQVGRVIAAYDDGDGAVRRKIMGSYKKDYGDSVKDAEFYRHADWGKVVVYDDRWWHAVYYDDIEIIAPVPHRYGFVPYVIRGTGMGDPTGLLASTQQDLPVGGVNSTDTRIAYKHVSPIHFMDIQHQQVEKIVGKLMTVWAKVDRPAWLWFHDEFAKAEGAPTVRTDGNAVTPMMQEHEDLKPLIDRIDPSVFGPLMSTTMQNRATNQMSPAGMGVNPGANASGNAIEGLADSSRDNHETPLTQAMESFHEAKASMRLRIIRDWGQLLRTSEDGDYGVLDIPHHGGRRRRDGLPPAFELTPEMLDRVGITVEAHLTSVQLRNLGPLGNAVNQWTSSGLMSRREGIALRGHPDPDDVFDELDYEETLQDPDIKKGMRLKKLRDRDPEAYQIVRELMQAQQPQGGPPQGMGGPPPMPGLPGPNSTSGVNLQALGMGQQGPTGRPPEAGPPPPPPGSILIPPGANIGL